MHMVHIVLLLCTSTALGKRTVVDMARLQRQNENLAPTDGSDLKTTAKCPEEPGMVTHPTIAGGRRVRGCCAELPAHTKKKDNVLNKDALAKKVVEYVGEGEDRTKRVFYCKAFLVHGPDMCKCGEAKVTQNWGGTFKMMAGWHNPETWHGYWSPMFKIEEETYQKMTDAVGKLAMTLLTAWKEDKMEERELERAHMERTNAWIARVNNRESQKAHDLYNSNDCVVRRGNGWAC